MIEILNVTKTFEDGKNKITAVDNVSIKVNQGEIYGIIGYSGAGKSTLVRCINLLERPTKGKVLFKGKDLCHINQKELREKRKKIGMIFQNFNLFNSRNVYHNVAYPLKGAKLSKKEEQKKVRKLLEIVGLSDKEKSYPSQLSGGQKQRVAIARALANDPEVLLCDEATSALDPKTTKSILKLLKELKQKLGLTIILITHEMAVIKEICDRVSIMEEGRVVEEGGIVEIFSKPENETTKDFLETATNTSKIFDILKLEENVFDIQEGDILTKVNYLGNVTKDALISEVSRKFKVNASILYGNLEILNQTPVGELVVLFSGEDQSIQKSIDYFREKGILVEVIEHGRNSIEVLTKCS